MLSGRFLTSIQISNPEDNDIVYPLNFNISPSPSSLAQMFNEDSMSCKFDDDFQCDDNCIDEEDIISTSSESTSPLIDNSEFTSNSVRTQHSNSLSLRNTTDNALQQRWTQRSISMPPPLKSTPSCSNQDISLIDAGELATECQNLTMDNTDTNNDHSTNLTTQCHQTESSNDVEDLVDMEVMMPPSVSSHHVHHGYKKHSSSTSITGQLSTVSGSNTQFGRPIRSAAGWRIPLNRCNTIDSSNDAESKRRQVYVCVVFLKIGEIDTIKEQYAADVLIKAKWREPDLDHRCNSSEKLEYDWANSWTPKLYVENTIGDSKEHVYQMITFNEFGHAFLFEKRRVSGIFLENLELNHFPFDVQDLTITVASNLSSSEIRLVNDPDEPHRVNKQSFVDEQEWLLYKHIETEQRELAHEYADPSSVRPAVSVKCRAARRPAYFIWNIFLVTFLICSLSLVTFAVNRDLPQNRLQLTFTLVLTLVAFKFVVNQCLPKISYLTYLDKYVISSLFILTLICLWHGLIVVIDKILAEKFHITWDNLETYVIIAMALSYVAYNVGFVIMIYCVACKRRRIMKHKDREYLERVHVQMRSKGMRAKRMHQQTHQLHEVKENGQTAATFI